MLQPGRFVAAGRPIASTWSSSTSSGASFSASSSATQRRVVK